jgi:ABC-type glycerol-3-phosphate transport system substrate-binding protein
MASKRTGNHLLSARATRRQALRASISGALGLGTAAALGTPAQAARTFLRDSSRQTIKLVSWFQSDPSRNAVWATLVHQFNTSQKFYKVVMGGWSAEAYANEVLIQAQEARIDADLIILLPELGPRLMRSGLLAPIDDVVANVNVHPSKAHDFMRMNGHLYGLSIAEVPFALLYNEESFARAGITKPASTIEEWQSQLQRLTHKPHQYGIWAPNASAEIASWWFLLQDYCLAYDTVWARGQGPDAAAEY